MRLGTTAPLSGQWDSNTSWEFQIGRELPPLDRCASIGAVVLGECGVALTRTHRGCWELPGGHIEPGEGLVEGLVREVREEVAMRELAHELFGQILVRSRQSRTNPSTGKPYPSPGSVPYFICWGEQQDCEWGKEIVEVRHIGFAQLESLNLLDIPERGILEIGLAAASDLPHLSKSYKDLIQVRLPSGTPGDL